MAGQNGAEIPDDDTARSENEATDEFVDESARDGVSDSSESQLDMASALAAIDHEDPEQSEADHEGVSLEELSQSYQALVPEMPEPDDESLTEAPLSAESGGQGSVTTEEPGDIPVTPMAIIEALLFVGTPDSSEISGKDIAKLMRGVDESEVHRCVEALNDDYDRQGRAIRIVRHGSGYRVDLAQAVEPVRESFYGRARDVQLNQAAIDCLALVAYQPGVSREGIEQQRGQPSGGVLNQLVRRQLLEMKREGKGKSAVSRYFPTERLLQLSGMESLDDLPQVEEWQQ